MNPLLICRVALAIPLHKQFDYCLPDDFIPDNFNKEQLIGCRVRVPFGGKRQLIGVITLVDPDIDYPIEKIKKITQLIEHSALLSEKLWHLLNWAAYYYQHPIGDVFPQAIPTLLKQGKKAEFKAVEYWVLKDSALDIAPFKKSKKQVQALTELMKSDASTASLKNQGISRVVLNTLKEKGVIQRIERQPLVNSNWLANFQENDEKPTLTTEQAIAITAVIQQQNKFNCFLLEGITGSGKTEVYLNMLTPILTAGRQALIIVPEIGLTPQTVQRFKQRFNAPVYLKHSALNSREQLDTWLHAKLGSAAIVIGTRSAIFSDFKDLGIIILDEEHDSSLKQHEGFRYHARDFAIKRAHQLGIPIVLGTATPALETLSNALQGKYQHLKLTERAGNAKPPPCSLINLAGLPLQSGLSSSLITLMKKHLDKNNQIILFLNRRGYAPVLMCHECGWLVKCHRCDAFYTYHKSANYLHCHHCAGTLPIPKQCCECGSTQLISTGVGTEQLEETLNHLFPDYPSVRIDRDNTRKKESFNTYLKEINAGKYKILLGTQMLAKGHHFPNVTLVALIDVDSTLFCNDFRASERLAQLFTQVSGRAGRAEKRGQVVLQTHHPEHSLLQDLINTGYAAFSRSELKIRQQVQLPPFSFQALIRAESEDATLAENFLAVCKLHLDKVCELNKISQRLYVLGPIPASMERRAGKFRFQLLLQADQRRLITQTLHQVLPVLDSLKEGKKIRWSIDVDPIDFV
jgi:primosomal protein N' (replication factor Y)